MASLNATLLKNRSVKVDSAPMCNMLTGLIDCHILWQSIRASTTITAMLTMILLAFNILPHSADIYYITTDPISEKALCITVVIVAIRCISEFDCVS